MSRVFLRLAIRREEGMGVIWSVLANDKGILRMGSTMHI